MYAEDGKQQEINRQLKKLEYEVAKAKVRTSWGKKALRELNTRWDYQPGMFKHLK